VQKKAEYFLLKSINIHWHSIR